MTLERKPPGVGRSLALAGVIGQAGCIAPVCLLAGLFVGSWLDAALGVKPLFTLGLMLLAIPLSLYIVVLTILRATKAVAPGPPAQAGGESYEEDIH